MGNWDFTLSEYDKLCAAVVNSKYAVTTFEKYFQGQAPDGHPTLLIRHDLDLSSAYALGTAAIERKYNIMATYYFRMARGTYRTEILDKIASYGHEIGYHYDTMDKSKGNIESAIRLFGQELGEFRKKYPVKTVCAHGNSFTIYDNKDIWKKCTLSDFGLLGEPYLSLDYSKFAYFSDSGRTWGNSAIRKFEGKDRVDSPFNGVEPENTDGLIRVIGEGNLPNICILAHPERWSKNLAQFTLRYFLDTAFNWGKGTIYAYRSVAKRN